MTEDPVRQRIDAETGGDVLTKPKTNQKAKLLDEFMNMATSMARVSCCERGKHACILISRDLRVLSIGYNGPASRLHNGCLRPGDSGATGRGCGCVHAEVNACIQPRSGVPFYAILTAAPCEACAQVLINTGIRTVIYDRMTDSGKAGRNLLRLAGVGCMDFDNFPVSALGLGS